MQFDGTVPAAEQRATVQEAGGEVTRDLHIIGALGARLSVHERDLLQRSPHVDAVSANSPVSTSGDGRLRTSYIQSTKDDRAVNQIMVTGAGVNVAVLDTGIAGDLVDFEGGDGQSRVVASVVTNPDATTAADVYGHGTHVAGIIAGESKNRNRLDPLFGAYRGAAPDAGLVSVKVSDDQGATSLIDVIYGLQFVVDHKDDLNIRVVNLSLNATEPSSYKTDPLDAAAEAAWNSGIVVVAAAGNRGTATDAVDYAPGNDPYVISVGAVDDQGTYETSDDTRTTWSSRGTTADGVKKPEVLAPGAHIVSTMAPGREVPGPVPRVHQGRRVLPGRRHVDVGTGRVGHRGADARGPSGLDAGHGQDRPHEHAAPDRGRQGPGVNAYKAVEFNRFAEVPSANAGLTPSTFIDPATGQLDPSKASWSKASWSSAGELLKASWSKASWSCVCNPETSDSVDPTKASWSKASWSKASWSTDWSK